jgi:hypothetical protein
MEDIWPQPVQALYCRLEVNIREDDLIRQYSRDENQRVRHQGPAHLPPPMCQSARTHMQNLCIYNMNILDRQKGRQTDRHLRQQPAAEREGGREECREGKKEVALGCENHQHDEAVGKVRGATEEHADGDEVEGIIQAWQRYVFVHTCMRVARMLCQCICRCERVCAFSSSPSSRAQLFWGGVSCDGGSVPAAAFPSSTSFSSS